MEFDSIDMEFNTIAILFKTPSILKSVAGMLGIIDTIEKKVDKLTQSEYNAGVRCLKELRITNGNLVDFLNQARNLIRIAITHESHERKALAYINYAFCNYRLNEKLIAIDVLEEFIELDYQNNQQRAIKVAKDVFINSIFINIAYYRMYIFITECIKEGDIYSVYEKYWENIPSEQVFKKLQKAAIEIIKVEKQR